MARKQLRVVNNDGRRDKHILWQVKSMGLDWGLTLEDAEELHRQLGAKIAKHHARVSLPKKAKTGECNHE